MTEDRPNFVKVKLPKMLCSYWLGKEAQRINKEFRDVTTFAVFHNISITTKPVWQLANLRYLLASEFNNCLTLYFIQILRGALK